MRRKITLSVMTILLSTTAVWGQIKVNSSGKTFFGNGTNTNSYGTINLLNDGTDKGISFTGESGNSFGIFKYNNEGYLTRGGIGSGLKITSTGSIIISNGGLLSNRTSSSLFSVQSDISPTIASSVGYSFSYGDAIKCSVYENPLTYAYTAYYKSSSIIERIFYVLGDGTVYAKNGYLQSSDISGKTDIQPLTSSLSKLMALSPVSFEYKGIAKASLEGLSTLGSDSLKSVDEDSSDMNLNIKMKAIEQIKKETQRKRIGLIAQDVEKIVPEVVRTQPDGQKGIMYSDLVALLIEGVKELKDSLDMKDTRIQELEERIQTIESIFYTNVREMTKISKKSNSSPFETLEETILYQNTPNPFNRETEISYRVPQNTTSFICIYNLNGQQLKKYPLLDAPLGNIIISAAEFAAGIYIYSLIVNNQEIDSKRMVLTN